MPSRLDALQTTTSVDLRRFVGNFHNVAQQASFNIASGRNFKGFGNDFKEFSEAQMDAKRGFLEVLQRFFLRPRFGIDFASIFRVSKSQKSSFFLKKINDFHKIDVIEKVPKNTESWLCFRTPKRGQIDQTRC